MRSLQGLAPSRVSGFKSRLRHHRSYTYKSSRNMSKILISYRREDSADVTGRIYDRLIQVFPQSVFRDVDSIPLGVDVRKYLAGC